MATSVQVREAAGRIALPGRPTAPAVSRTLALTGARLAELVTLLISGTLLVASIFWPYWQITLHAPQYPKGLHVQAFVYKLVGDVFEVDGLNHYIGMMKLDDAGSFERQVALVAIPLVALLAVASFWLRGGWQIAARVPLVIYPVVFAFDLFAWLYYAGHSLDPHAPLSSSIKPFTPHILGHGGIGQFSTDAVFQTGFFMALIAALLVLGLTIAQRGKSDVAR